MSDIRVVAWNVHGFRAGPKAVAEAIAGEEPEIVVVNEAGSRRALGRFTSILAGQAGSGLRWRGGIPNAVVVRPPWRILQTRTIPFTRTGRLIPRGAVLCHLGRHGSRLWVASVHLGLSDREREVHARELTDLAAGLHGPVVIAGDLNEGPEGAAAAWLKERLWDAFAQAGVGEGLTFSATSPRARIDVVLHGDGLRAAGAWVLDTAQTRAASDHLPVFADLQLAEDESPAG